uniref:Protein RFT1 homolog n=1 Tax=Angiostrongylus cantonensis TaxID=6313 RepID=A0A0K0D3L1_ANGCA
MTPAIRSAVFYVGSTLVCSLLGKIVVTRFFFDYPIVILMLQMATTLFIIELLRVIGVLKLSPYSFDKGRHFFLPSILLCIAQWLTLSAFEGIGMPAFDSVKREKKYCLNIEFFVEALDETLCFPLLKE